MWYADSYGNALGMPALESDVTADQERAQSPIYTLHMREEESQESDADWDGGSNAGEEVRQISRRGPEIVRHFQC